MRIVVERHWPALLVVSVSVGIALAIWLSLPLAATLGATVVVAIAAGVLDGAPRLLAVALALVLVGLTWGSLRMDALRASVLSRDVGETGVAELVTVGAARSSPWSILVIATTREFRRVSVRERVLLVLPVGRSPPRGGARWSRSG